MKHSRAPGVKHVLSRLYLMLFLRGSSARGLSKSAAPASLPRKLGLTLAVYALVGGSTFAWTGKPVFVLALSLHSLTFFLLGTFIVASAGSMLFNADENDILLHRPIVPQDLLYAKVGTLVRVSLWLAGALNAAGMVVGLMASDSSWWFPIVHAASILVEALFVAGLVVLIYELCLRWFGRQRLDALITSAQVLVAVGAVLVGQAPRLLIDADLSSESAGSMWLWLAPPAWFAGIDAALAGGGGSAAWLGASAALAATGVTLWLAFGKLAASYQDGLQQLSEVSAPRRGGRANLIRALVESPPLSWWLRATAERAAFLLCVAYLARDRDTKLRVYPALASVGMLPVIILIGTDEVSYFGAFGAAFAGAMVGLNAMSMVDLLRYSQQYRAADLFQQAPIASPAPLSSGVRAAALVFLVAPLAALVATIVFWLAPDLLPLIVPGILTAPVFAHFAALTEPVIPLSSPAEQAKAHRLWAIYLLATALTAALAGVVSWSWSSQWFKELVLGELLLVVLLCVGLERRSRAQKWPSLE